MENFNAKDYWEERLGKNYGLDGVGYIGHGVKYNEWMYRIRKKIFRKYVTNNIKDIDNKAVLDIGSGTGFYINLWKKAGVKDLTGMDLTSVAVQNLEKNFPGIRFYEGDVSDNISHLFGGKKFDVISAFDVLFHVVDEDKFRKAIANISGLIKKDGLFILSDNFVHDKPSGGVHHVNRTLRDFTEVLEANDLEIIMRKPSFYFFNAPVDTDSKFLKRMWNTQSRIIYRGEKYANILGALLYPIELLILNLIKEGPSTEIMICRKKGE